MTDHLRLTWVMALQTAVIAALVVAGILNYIQQDAQNARLIRQETAISCHQGFVTRLADALSERAAVGDQTRAAALAYAQVLTTSAAGSTTREKAFATYAATVDRADAELAANPIPANTCT
jgi:hypothetical protein